MINYIIFVSYFFNLEFFILKRKLGCCFCVVILFMVVVYKLIENLICNLKYIKIVYFLYEIY